MQNDIAEKTVTPGQFFVLKFDFSTVYRGPNMNMAAQSLRGNLALVFRNFYDTYANYLGGDASKHYDKIDPKDPSISILNCTKLVNDVR